MPTAADPTELPSATSRLPRLRSTVWVIVLVAATATAGALIWQQAASRHRDADVPVPITLPSSADGVGVQGARIHADQRVSSGLLTQGNGQTAALVDGQNRQTEIIRDTRNFIPPSMALESALTLGNFDAARKAIEAGGRISLWKAAASAPAFMVANDRAVFRTTDDCDHLLDPNTKHGQLTSGQMLVFRHFCVTEELPVVRERLAQLVQEIEVLPNADLRRCVMGHHGKRTGYAKELARFKGGAPNDDLERCAFDHCSDRNRLVLDSASLETFRESVSLACIDSANSPDAHRLKREAYRLRAVVEGIRSGS